MRKKCVGQIARQRNKYGKKTEPGRLAYGWRGGRQILLLPRRFPLPFLLVVLLIVVVCSGCSLAKADQQEMTAANHLCGLFVSTQQEAEAMSASFYDENGDWIPVYARAAEKGGKKQWAFPGVDGYAFFLESEGEGEEETVRAAGSGSEMEVEIKEGEGVERKLSGTLYFSGEYTDEAIAVRPVFQDQRGYYLGEVTASTQLTDGFDISMDAQWTWTEKGKRRTDGISCRLDLRQADEIRAVSVRELNRHDETLRTTGIRFAGQSREMKLLPETSYVLVEEEIADEQGRSHIKHTAYDWRQPADSNESVSGNAAEDRNDDGEHEALTHQCFFTGNDWLVTPKTLIFVK